MDLEKDFYRQSITFDVVDEYGSPIRKRSFFYDHIVSYAPYKASREPGYEGYIAAQSTVTLRHKTDDGLFADKSFFTSHSVEELEDLYAEAEYKIESRKPFELQQSSKIKMDFLRATVTVTATNDPMAGSESRAEHIFYDQFIGHHAYTLSSQCYPIPFAKTSILLKNEGCFGKRELHITQTEDELRALFLDAEEKIEAKAIGLLKQLNL
jgi:hypothetical protein|tara:strand:+ start:140238 stop:140867 length:630 start_codon:yes stop_codon:yes gene_type:complete